MGLFYEWDNEKKEAVFCKEWRDFFEARDKLLEAIAKPICDFLLKIINKFKKNKTTGGGRG